MTLSPRRLLVVFLLLLALAGIALPGGWYLSAQLLSRAIEDWAVGARAAGYSVSYRGLRIEGFPFSLQAIVNDFTLALPPSSSSPETPAAPATTSDAPRWSLRGSEGVFTLRPWNLRHIAFTLPGTYEITYPTRARQRSLFAVAGATHGFVTLDQDGAPVAGYFDVSEVELVGEEGDRPSPGSFESYAEGARLKRAALNLRRAATTLPGDPGDGAASSQEALDLTFRFEDVTLPVEDGLVLGRSFARLQGALQWRGAWPAGDFESAAAAWRDGGGTLDLSGLILSWGPLQLEGEGTFALDPELQPMGAMTIQARGYDQTIDVFVEKGLFPAGEAAATKILLSLLAKHPEDGSPPLLKAPLTLQERRLKIGPVPLLHFAPIDWRAIF